MRRIYPNIEVGQRFERLKITGLNSIARNKIKLWNYICDCGTSGVARDDLLQTGKTRSCGCLKRDNWINNLSKKFDAARKPKVVTVKGQSMVLADALKNHLACPKREFRERLRDGWDFEEALLTPQQRRREYKATREAFGEKATLAELVRKHASVSRQTVYIRLRQGWDLETALTAPDNSEDTRLKPGHNIRKKGRAKAGKPPSIDMPSAEDWFYDS